MGGFQMAAARALFEVGGMDAFSSTRLFGLAHDDEWRYVIVNVPMFWAGRLFGGVVAGEIRCLAAWYGHRRRAPRRSVLRMGISD